MRNQLFVVALVFAACGPEPLPGEFDDTGLEADNGHDDYQTVEQGLVECGESQSTGYRNGNAFPITLIRVDGYLVEKTTGNVYAQMQAAAAAAGVSMRINSGFRTPQEQQYLYNCYRNCNCNSCNLAAAPGYSNHQSGTALDLNTANGAVLNWLNNNAARFGFRRTVPSEPWHWEYFGGGPGGGPCSAPPPCDRSSGGFTFSCDGSQSGLACVNVDEPSDPNTWNDNFFCSARDFGMRWSYAGPIAGWDCANVHESSEANPAIWADNFLCTPPQSPWTFSWSSAGPIAGKNCVHWNETADPNSWHDNYLCTDAVGTFSNGGFTFTTAGAGGRSNCVNVDEPSDPDTWSDNFFCTPSDFGMRWSYAGPIDGMTCTNVHEGAESQAAMWADNFLCVPQGSPLRFHWSSAGPITGLPCVRWYEHSETSATWIDNWMCMELSGVSSGDLVLTEEPPLPVIIDEPEADETDPGVQQPMKPGDVTAMHLQSQGCSAVPSVVPLLLGAWLLRRRRR
ncbi:MAG: M15 family metallopeptidase [Archangium sp.]